MFGINNDKVEFADIKMGFVRPPKDASTAAGGAAAGKKGAAGPEAADGMKADDDEEEMSLEDGEEFEELMNGEDKSKICSSQTTCAAHLNWCAQTQKDEIPGDCVEKFMD